jgi:hypothetical protein
LFMTSESSEGSINQISAPSRYLASLPTNIGCPEPASPVTACSCFIVNILLRFEVL